ncbi:unnamed protein product [Ascophyllum nodosum]
MTSGIQHSSHHLHHLSQCLHRHHPHQHVHRLSRNLLHHHRMDHWCHPRSLTGALHPGSSRRNSHLQATFRLPRTRTELI